MIATRNLSSEFAFTINYFKEAVVCFTWELLGTIVLKQTWSSVSDKGLVSRFAQFGIRRWMHLFPY